MGILNNVGTAVKNWWEAPKGHVGAAGLPDYGATELISDVFGGGQRTSQGGSDLTKTGTYGHIGTQSSPNQEFYQGSIIPQLGVAVNPNYSDNLVKTPEQIKQEGLIQDDVNLGKDINFGGGGSGGGVNTTKVDPNQALVAALQSQLGQAQGLYQSLMEREAAAQQAREQAARLGYQNILEQSERMKTQAQADRDAMSESIAQRYGVLADRLAGQRDNLQNKFGLDQSQIDYNYAKAQAQARKGFQDTERRNRMIARATNRGDSSFYDDIMEENATNLDSNLMGLGTEREDKTRNLYEQLNQANTQLDQAQADIKMQENDMIQQVEKQYVQDIETAKQLAAQGLVDYNSAVAGVQANAANNIAQIQAAAQNARLSQAQVGASYQQMMAQLAAINPQRVDTNLSNPLLANLQSQNVNMGQMADNSPSQALQMALARSSGGKLDDISKLLGRR